MGIPVSEKQLKTNQEKFLDYDSFVPLMSCSLRYLVCNLGAGHGQNVEWKALGQHDTVATLVLSGHLRL